jgi:hypothetical protein
MTNENNFFISLNRVLTNGVSSLIASAVWAGTYYGFISLGVITPIETNLIPYLNFIILGLGLFLGSLIYSFLQNYFCRLLEKSKYTNLGHNLMLAMMYNLTVFVLTLILAFALYTQTENAGFYMLIAQLSFYFISATYIREEKVKKILLATPIGLITGVVFSAIIVLISANQSTALASIVGIFSLPIIAMINSGIEELFYLFKPVDENQELAEMKSE